MLVFERFRRVSNNGTADFETLRLPKEPRDPPPKYLPCGPVAGWWWR
jgi:hypothetical protein